jgi:hypothetical protein
VHHPTLLVRLILPSVAPAPSSFQTEAPPLLRRLILVVQALVSVPSAPSHSPLHFPPYRDKPPWPGAAARLSSGRPWPSAIEESTVEPWTSSPCAIHHSMGRVHTIYYSKIIPKLIIPASFTKNPLYSLQIKPHSTNSTNSTPGN